MSASASRPLPRPERFGRLWWLPAGGRGNGLTDTAWVPIAAVDGAVVPALLAELHAAGVPAYAAPVTRRPSRPKARDAAPRHHLWVGASRYGQAEETLRTRLPALTARQRELTARQPDTPPARRRRRTGGKG